MKLKEIEMVNYFTDEQKKEIKEYLDENKDIVKCATIEGFMKYDDLTYGVLSFKAVIEFFYKINYNENAKFALIMDDELKQDEPFKIVVKFHDNVPNFTQNVLFE